MNIIGRESELAILNGAMQSSKSELIAVYGRRRVGKTFLIKEACKNKLWFSISGKHNVPTGIQLQRFATHMNGYYDKANHIATPKNWFTAFDELKAHLLAIPDNNKKVILFDELPWLDTPRSNFLSALDDFWNDWCVDQKNIVFVICGSSASWMIKKILNNKGGLHNRVTQRLRIIPFTLLETKKLLQAKNIYYSDYEITQLYMVTGGIPFYLDAIQRGKSLVQNINEICFTKDGLLADEFDNLYKALFNNAKRHEKIIQVLANHTHGVTRNQLLKKAKMKSGGLVTDVLNELIESGFVSETASVSKADKNNTYRLIDEYSLFYLKFILPNKKNEGVLWADISKTQSYTTWCGYAFENICLQHVHAIKTALGITGVSTKVYSWFNGNAQIDMIIDRADNCVHLIEIKFYNGSLTITKYISENLQNKISNYKQSFGNKKYVMLTVISTFGITENVYSNSLIEHKLQLTDLFLA